MISVEINYRWHNLNPGRSCITRPLGQIGITRHNHLCACHEPVNATTTRLFCTDYRNDIADTPHDRQRAVDFQLAVAAEDRALLERVRRKGVPLDVTAEVHTKADRITLEMRRILGELVTATG